ncbi:MAG: hypothetical protein Q4F74_03015 [Synergistaceae bacterium]|nr:hypothetical protein [Synergistaceae bacterium]
MAETKMFPTIEEFTKEVKRYFKDDWPQLSDAEVDRYLATDEAQDVIKTRYEEGKGKKCLMIGSAASAGNCLDLMY